MYFSLLSLAFIVIHVEHALECSVCVLEPLITSPVKCPICIENDGDKTDIRNKMPQELTQAPNSYSCNNNKINWTTCFVQAQPCNASYKYRIIDGSCNNLKDPTLGMADTVYLRLVPDYYQDHKHKLSLGSDGQPQPLSRVLRTAFFPDQEVADSVSLAVMQWGQIVAHDISWGIMIASAETLDCCNLSKNEDKDICLPIVIPKTDRFYSHFNVTCLNISRNNFTFIGSCSENQPRQQSNAATHAIDTSFVYGSNLQVSNAIREFKGGRLKTQRSRDGRIFLANVPPSEVYANCFVKSANEPCYVGGDDRVTQNTQLTVLQIMLVRQHNRMAERLEELHKDWDDETIFQETRNILIAVVQQITYNDWLVYYLGHNNMEKYKLYPRKNGYTKYKNDVNLATLSSFAGAAFRFPHSGIQGFLSMLNYQREIQRRLPISDWTTRPLIIQENNNYDQLLLGLTDQPMRALGRYFTEQMTNLLFHNDKPHGLDLMSIDIERGRDHGLAPYVYYHEICTGQRVVNFQDLYKFVPKEHVDKFEQYYKSVKDIDLMVGGSLEIKVPNTRLGPTFLCITTEQFYRKKWGDRFWYEVQGQPHSFTKSQLAEIKKASLSRLICDNSDNITRTAINSFLPPSKTNRIVPCSSIPTVNLDKWK